MGVNTVSRVRLALEWGVMHAALFSALALAHNLSGATLTYWKFYDPVYRLGGPQFPHDNQQVAYQLLLLTGVLAAGFAGGEARPFAQQRWRRLWLLGAIALVYAGTVTCRPRSGLLLGTVLVVAALALRGVRAKPEHRRRVAWFAVAAAGALALALTTVRPLRETVARFGEFSRQPSTVFTGGSFRPLQHRVAWAMVADQPWLGWGGGSYLYLSPVYAPRVPELMQALRNQRQNHRPVFPHADGDWLEFIVEYGVAGAALLVTIAVSWLVWMLGRIRLLGTSSLVMAAGVLLVLAQALIDPVLRNPVVLATLAATAWLAVMLQRERENRRAQT
jgi:O-antigen ligase